MKRFHQKIRRQLNDPHKKDIISKSSGYIIFRLIGILGGYLFTYTIAKTYGASLNGLVTLSFAIFMFASTFGSLGINVNLVKYYSSLERWQKDPGLFYRVVTKSLIFSCFLTFFLFLFKDFIVLQLFEKPQLMPIYNWAIFAIPGWTMIKNFAGVLRAKGLNNWFSFFNNASRFSLAFLLLISFNFINLNITNAIKAHFYSIYFLALIAFIVVLKNFKTISFVSKTNSWQFLREAFPMFMSSSIIVFLGWLDSFVLGIYVDDSAIGIYSVAIKLAMICAFSMEAINSGLAPKVASLYREGKQKEFKKLIHFVTFLNFGITVAIVVGIVIVNKWLLGLFGEEFKSGTVVLLILCSVHLINSAMGSAAIIMQMTGYQKQYRNIALVSLVLNLTLNFILIPPFGITGAALSTAFSLSVWNVGNAVFLKRKENIVTYFNPFQKFKQ